MNNEELLERIRELENDKVDLELKLALEQDKRIESDTALNEISSLEIKKSEFVDTALKIASSSEHNLDDVLMFITNCARNFNGDDVNATLYEVHPTNRYSREKIEQERTLGGLVIDDQALFEKYNTKDFDGLIKKDRNDRYEVIRMGNLLGDAVFLTKPIIVRTTQKEYSLAEGVKYKKYKSEKNKAAFPIIDAINGTVNSLLLVESKNPLSIYETGFIRRFVYLATNAITYKQAVEYSSQREEMIKQGFHDLDGVGTLVLMYNKYLDQELKKETPDFNDVEKFQKSIKNGINSFMNLTEQIKNREFTYTSRAVIIDEVVEELTSEASNLYSNINIITNLNLGEEHIYIDKEGFKKCFYNITKNASEQSDDIGRKLDLIIKTEIIDDKTYLTFSDNGGGVPDNTYEEILRTNQCHTTKKHGSGSGIGSVFATFKQMGFDVEIYNPGRDSPEVKGLTYVISPHE